MNLFKMKTVSTTNLIKNLKEIKDSLPSEGAIGITTNGNVECFLVDYTSFIGLMDLLERSHSEEEKIKPKENLKQKEDNVIPFKRRL